MTAAPPPDTAVSHPPVRDAGAAHDVEWGVAVERAWAAGNEARVEARRRADHGPTWSGSGSDIGQGPTSAELVPLHLAGGRVLARGLAASTEHPAFASSAMDGWAVRGDGPWRVGAPIAAGSPLPKEPLGDGEARPVSTGAPLPSGTAAVLRSEFGDVRHTGSGPVLETNAFARAGDPQRGQHIRPLGEEAHRGEVVVPPGAVIDAPVIAAAAGLGYDALLVQRRPAVELVLLGDELCVTGRPGPGRVRDALGPALPAALAHCGAEVLGLHRAADSHAATVAALSATRAGLVVTTGGSARGTADFVRSAIDALGGRMLIDGVAMRPGHPVKLAVLPDGRLLLALPGNPLAAMLAFASVGAPLLAGLTGRRRRHGARMLVGTGIPNRNSSVRFVPCVQGEDGAVASAWQGSAMLRGLAEADAVLVVPPGGVAAGSVAEALPLPW